MPLGDHPVPKFPTPQAFLIRRPLGVVGGDAFLEPGDALDEFGEHRPLGGVHAASASSSAGNHEPSTSAKPRSVELGRLLACASVMRTSPQAPAGPRYAESPLLPQPS